MGANEEIRNFVPLNMEWRKHIIADETVLPGRPTVKGTCISVEHTHWTPYSRMDRTTNS
ncbi:DUF433 domain-containing protein [Marivirga tractuosa]|uniref:hypothetical protein n=1 Tax=Marivirga tractuosa TaxID=1006 RepID=UPI001FDEE8C9|nr:hypothetical protein [Marivirga tractuosa]